MIQQLKDKPALNLSLKNVGLENAFQQFSKKQVIPIN